MSTKTMLDVSRDPLKKTDQDIEKTCSYRLGWPNEKQSTLAGLLTSTCKKIPIHKKRH